MFRFRVFLYLHFTIFIADTEAFIEQFAYKNVLPKCCNENEVLSLFIDMDRVVPHKCVFDVNRTSHVLVSNISSNFPRNLFDGVSCVDDAVAENGEERKTVKIDADTLRMTYLNLKGFPKCCPANKAYDSTGHRCVPTTNGTDVNFTMMTDAELDVMQNKLYYLKIGLSGCKTVIADYELRSLDQISYHDDKSVVLETFGKSFPYGNYCIDKVYEKNAYVVRACEDFGVCRKSPKDASRTRCVRKCCQDGYYYKGGGKCKFEFKHGIGFYNDSKVINPNENFAIIHGHSCRHYIVPSNWSYTLDEVGSLNLNLEENKGSHSAFETTYCFEEVETDRIQGRQLLLCFKYETNDSTKFEVSRIALLISCIFLTLTLLGYGILPEMQNLHGKTLMCNCASLLVAFTILDVLQFYPTIKGAACKITGYLCMYTFLAAFTWSNVMGFDIWWTFGSMRAHSMFQKKKERKRFLWYCLYAWTFPLLITVTAYTIQHFSQSLPESMKEFVPTLGGFSCFFEESTNLKAFLVWFNIPIAILCICNIVLFVKTILYCYKVKNEIEKMRDAQPLKNECKKILSADKERLRMAIKLFLVMGLPWIFEIISTCLTQVYAKGTLEVVIIVFDTFNCMQGVFIFCVFVLKKTFLRALRNRLWGKGIQRPSPSIVSGTTASSYVGAASCKTSVNKKMSQSC